MVWSKLSVEEMERRRLVSVEEMARRDRAGFDESYQEMCDQEYWTFGQCCAGCDHWMSDMARIGQCKAAGIVSGADVMRSQGISFSSLPYKPGFPWTDGHHHCGMFKDDFDWSTLDREYLERIGAMRDGKMRPKPSHARAV